LPDLSAFVRVGPNEVRLLRDGTAAFPAMLDAIADAKREILLEMYWVGADRVGHRFRDALVERARAGVRVCVIYDAVGSLETPEAFWGPLVAAGAEIREFSPISPFKRPFSLSRLVFRDHRKLLVVDGATGFVGGINLGDAWLPEDGPEAAWRDDGIEIRGPAAGSVRAAFYGVWRRLGGASPFDVRRMTPRSPGGVRVLTNRVERRPNRPILRTYLQAIGHAQRSVDIASAYFLPGVRFLRALRAAARRGVRVRVLVSERSDVQIVALAMSSLYGRLLADGVEVFAYAPRVLHSKTAVFDDRLTMIGSHNLDAASTRFNLECDVAVESAELARIVRASFERDLTDARKLDLESWKSRPAWLRLAGWGAALFERLL
jgi:cardiolipin synthase